MHYLAKPFVISIRNSLPKILVIILMLWLVFLNHCLEFKLEKTHLHQIIMIIIKTPKSFASTFDRPQLTSKKLLCPNMDQWGLIKCKLFVRTFIGVALDWFNGLPDNSVAHFDKFPCLFIA